jgi:hypothetical protein
MDQITKKGKREKSREEGQKKRKRKVSKAGTGNANVTFFLGWELRGGLQYRSHQAMDTLGIILRKQGTWVLFYTKR